MGSTTTDFDDFLNPGALLDNDVNQTDTLYLSTNTQLLTTFAFEILVIFLKQAAPLEIKIKAQEVYGYGHRDNELLEFSFTPTVTKALGRLPDTPTQLVISDIRTARTTAGITTETLITFASPHSYTQYDWVFIKGGNTVAGQYSPSQFYITSDTELVLMHNVAEALPLISGETGYVELNGANIFAVSGTITVNFDTLEANIWKSAFRIVDKAAGYSRLRGVVNDATVIDTIIPLMAHVMQTINITVDGVAIVRLAVTVTLFPNSFVDDANDKPQVQQLAYVNERLDMNLIVANVIYTPPEPDNRAKAFLTFNPRVVLSAGTF